MAVPGEQMAVELVRKEELLDEQGSSEWYKDWANSLRWIHHRFEGVGRGKICNEAHWFNVSRVYYLGLSLPQL